LFAGCNLVVTWTAAPFRSLKTPEVRPPRRVEPGEDRHLVAAGAAQLDELLAHTAVGLAVGSLTSPTTKTESPYGA